MGHSMKSRPEVSSISCGSHREALQGRFFEGTALQEVKMQACTAAGDRST
jgi:hypothetical protein